MLPINQILTYIPEEFQGLIGVIVAVGLVAITCIKSFKFVPQGEYAMRKRWGRVVVKRDGTITYLKPGRPQVLIPFVDTLEYVSNLNRTVPVTMTRIPRDDQLISIDGIAIFKVIDTFKVRYAVDNFGEYIRGATTAAFRDTIITLWDDGHPVSETPDYDLFLSTFTDAVQTDAELLGVAVVTVRITEYSPDGQFAIAQAIDNATREIPWRPPLQN